MERTGFHTADDGTRIWYGMSGEGPHLVLCDGLACDGFIWPYVVDRLVDGFTIVRWHYAAHGRSELPDDLSSLSVERFAQDLEGVLEAIGADDAILAGHSMGVQVILEAYRRFADRIRGLVAICGNYKRPLDTFHNTDTLRRVLPYVKAFVQESPGTSQALWRRVVDSGFSKLVATVAETNPALMRSRDIDPYLEHVAQMNVDAFVQMLENVAEHSAEELLSTIDVPVLVIAGQDDTFTPMFRSEEMAETIPDARLVVVPGGTHATPLESPDLVVESMQRFFGRLDLTDR